MSLVNHSIYYRLALTKAKEYLANPERISVLAQKLKTKMQRQRVYDAVSEVWDMLHCFLRLLNAYVKGRYRKVPVQSLLMMIACLIYFAMVVDLVPDFITGLGLLDDVALIKWTWDAVKNDIEAFRQWEANGETTQNLSDD